jgi:hypothetical protein
MSLSASSNIGDKPPIDSLLSYIRDRDFFLATFEKPSGNILSDELFVFDHLVLIDYKLLEKYIFRFHKISKKICP